jgi:hypothetical protein
MRDEVPATTQVGGIHNSSNTGDAMQLGEA